MIWRLRMAAARKQRAEAMHSRRATGAWQRAQRQRTRGATTGRHANAALGEVAGVILAAVDQLARCHSQRSSATRGRASAFSATPFAAVVRRRRASCVQGLACMLPSCSPRAETSRVAVISCVASAWSTLQITVSAPAPHGLAAAHVARVFERSAAHSRDWRHADVVLSRHDGADLCCRRASCRYRE